MPCQYHGVRLNIVLDLRYLDIVIWHYINVALVIISKSTSSQPNDILPVSSLRYFRKDSGVFYILHNANAAQIEWNRKPIEGTYWPWGKKKKSTSKTKKTWTTWTWGPMAFVWLVDQHKPYCNHIGLKSRLLSWPNDLHLFKKWFNSLNTIVLPSKAWSELTNRSESYKGKQSRKDCYY